MFLTPKDIPKGAIYISKQSTTDQPVAIEENPLQKIDRLVSESFLPAVSKLLQKDSRTKLADIDLKKIEQIPGDAVIDTQKTDTQKNLLDGITQKIHLLREYIGKLLSGKILTSDDSLTQLTNLWSSLLNDANQISQDRTNSSQAIDKIDLQIQTELNNLRL